MKRRSFLKTTSASLAGLTAFSASSRLFSPRNVMGRDEDMQKKPVEIEHRILGRTGLSFSILGFGAMRTSDPAVIRQAVEMGVNNIDTARAYMDGRNEEIVGKAIKGIRDNVYITSKIRPGSFDEMVRDTEASLKALGTDTIDILLFHSKKNPDDLDKEPELRFIEKMKKEGKARFIGFSTHRKMTALIQKALEQKNYDVILTAFNFKSDQELSDAILAASEAGIGIIAMKTQAGGYKDSKMNASPHQAALKWVWSNPGVTCAIPAMVTFEQLDENFAAMSQGLGWMERKTLHKYGQQIDNRLCRMCGQCDGQCPYGVSVADINRCLMYAEGYQDLELARFHYRQLDRSENLEPCSGCDRCSVSCAHGLSLAATIDKARHLFA